MISNAEAKRIATEWQRDELEFFSFVSNGTIERSFLGLIRHLFFIKWPFGSPNSKFDDPLHNERSSLYTYVKQQGERGPQEGWCEL